jgi:hypothetical protein
LAKFKAFNIWCADESDLYWPATALALFIGNYSAAMSWHTNSGPHHQQRSACRLKFPPSAKKPNPPPNAPAMLLPAFANNPPTEAKPACRAAAAGVAEYMLISPLGRRPKVSF